MKITVYHGWLQMIMSEIHPFFWLEYSPTSGIIIFSKVLNTYLLMTSLYKYLFISEFGSWEMKMKRCLMILWMKFTNGLSNVSLSESLMIYYLYNNFYFFQLFSKRDLNNLYVGKLCSLFLNFLFFFIFDFYYVNSF